MVLAGGAAGVAAAFNTPLAGVVFAIEELSHSFEARTSGKVLTAVIIAGITTMALVGNYTYFGTAPVELDFGVGWGRGAGVRHRRGAGGWFVQRAAAGCSRAVCRVRPAGRCSAIRSYSPLVAV